MLHLLEGSISYVNNLEFFCTDLFILPYLFILSFIYTRMDSWIFILYFGLQFNFSPSHTVLALATGSSLVGSFGILVLYVEYFLIFSHNKMLQAHLLGFLLQNQNQPFLQEALVLFIGKWYQKPRSGHQMCSLLLGCHFCQTLS